MKTKVTKSPSTRTLTFVRTFTTPRDKVFAAFANLDQLEQWWTPPGFHPETATFDFKTGGSWHYNAVGMMEGQRIESWTNRRFTEVAAPEKIVVRDAFSDPAGGINPDMPQSTQTFEFIEEGKQTKLIATATYDTDEGYEKILGFHIVEGIDETLGQLETLLNN